MRFETSLSALAACLVLAAAAGCASKGATKAPPPKPGATASKPAPAGAPGSKPAETTPAEPEAKPAASAATPAEGKSGETPAATATKPAAPEANSTGATPAAAAAGEPSPPPAAAASGGFENFMRRTGRSIEETKFLGMRIRPYLTEEIGYTDNVYYQDENERLVIDKDPDNNDADGDGNANAFESDGVDNDADGLVDEAGESLAEPQGEVAEIFSNLNLGVGFELSLNSVLLTALGESGQSLEVAKLDLNYIEYFKESDSPDAFNVNAHIDLPWLLRIAKDINRNAFYFRVEGDYSEITDPLDVATYQFQGANPSLNTVGTRSDFTRTEWWTKATAGWKGGRMDALVSARLYEMTLDDDDLSTADHTETELYAEIGYGPRTEGHRYYLFAELTIFDFDERGPGGDVPGLRNFDKTRAGVGWEGPFLSRKVRGKVEGYMLQQDIEDDDVGPFPFSVDSNGNPVSRPFDDYSGPGGLVRLVYRPFVTKPTELQVEYSKDFTWSVVAEHKEVDQGYISLSHPINERFSTQIRYSLTHENVAHREVRLFQEAGLRLSYKIASFTQVYFQYTLRHMDSQEEVTARYSDADNELFDVRADGDFIANIFSVGISFRF